MSMVRDSQSEACTNLRGRRDRNLIVGAMTELNEKCKMKVKEPTRDEVRKFLFERDTILEVPFQFFTADVPQRGVNDLVMFQSYFV